MPSPAYTLCVQALRTGQRIDGRGPLQYRSPRFHFTLDTSTCTVHLGSTLAVATITAALQPPFPDRHSEGSVSFTVSLSPLSAFDGPFSAPSSKANETAIEAARLIERGLRESRAIDVEALCVLPGRRVWHLAVDVRVLSDDGNALDAAGLAALAALCAYRRPDVTVDADAPGGVVVHAIADKEPVPLTLHHLPLPITFAFFPDEGSGSYGSGGDTQPAIMIVVDPVLKEEAAAAGSLTVTVTPQGEVCAVQKAKGCGVSSADVLRCLRIATKVVRESTRSLRKALETNEKVRLAARVRRKTVPTSALSALSVDLHGGNGEGTIEDVDMEQHARAEGVTNEGGDALQGNTAANARHSIDRDLPEEVRKAVEHAREDDEPSDSEEGGSVEHNGDASPLLPAAAGPESLAANNTTQETATDGNDMLVDRAMGRAGGGGDEPSEGEAPNAGMVENVSLLAEGMKGQSRTKQDKMKRRRVSAGGGGMLAEDADEEEERSGGDDPYAAIANLIAQAGVGGKSNREGEEAIDTGHLASALKKK